MSYAGTVQRVGNFHVYTVDIQEKSRSEGKGAASSAVSPATALKVFKQAKVVAVAAKDRFAGLKSTTVTGLGYGHEVHDGEETSKFGKEDLYLEMRGSVAELEMAKRKLQEMQSVLSSGSAACAKANFILDLAGDIPVLASIAKLAGAIVTATNLDIGAKMTQLDGEITDKLDELRQVGDIEVGAREALERDEATRELKAENQELRGQVAEQKKEIDSLKEQMKEMMKMMTQLQEKNSGGKAAKS
jgi:uncharacterized coiled-coil protein SlyX